MPEIRQGDHPQNEVYVLLWCDNNEENPYCKEEYKKESSVNVLSFPYHLVLLRWLRWFFYKRLKYKVFVFMAGYGPRLFLS